MLVLQNLAWLNVLCSVSKVFITWLRGRSPAVSHSPLTAGLTRRSSGRSTAGQVWLSPERPCRRCPPLTSNVRPPRRHMRERQHFAISPRATGALAEFASGCPSIGGQRASRFPHQALSQSSTRPSESRVAQRPVQRLEGLQHLLLRSLAGAVISPPTAGLTRRSSGRSTAGHVRLSSVRPCRRCPPLTSNVRPPRRHMRERHFVAMLPSAVGALAESALGCPSAGGQRTMGLAHRALPQRYVGPSESCMAQRSVQRLEGLHHLVARSLAGGFTFASHRRPNPSVKRTVNGGAGLAVSGKAVPPLPAAYLKR